MEIRDKVIFKFKTKNFVWYVFDCYYGYLFEVHTHLMLPDRGKEKEILTEWICDLTTGPKRLVDWKEEMILFIQSYRKKLQHLQSIPLRK